ncbi:hypothetical protein KKI24_23875 [bacterium]|nr:hypothetical protein [bacterium]
MTPPETVLSEALENAVGGRKVRYAVFLSYNLDPEFFELHILPLLFDVGFSDMENVKRMQLDDEIRSINQVAVYYDHRALRTGGGAAVLDYKRYPVTRRNGVFHAKNVFLLVENIDEKTEESWESLIILTTSANLTESGWWRNLETGHILELNDGDSTQIRQDLIGRGGLFAKVRNSFPAETKHEALDAIWDFVAKRTYEHSQRSYRGILKPRMYVGQKAFSLFLKEHIGPRNEEYNLEIISPYVEATGNAGLLKEFIEKIRPDETRMYLPRDKDDNVTISEAYFNVVEEEGLATWSRLPGELLRWSKNDDSAAKRFSHAKVYRLFSSVSEKEFIIAGSTNFTQAAHAGGSDRNFETSIVYDTTQEGVKPNWWLIPEKETPSSFVPSETEDSEGDLAAEFILLEYDWEKKWLSYFWQKSDNTPREAVVRSSSIDVLSLKAISTDRWVKLRSFDSDLLEERLRVSALVTIGWGSIEQSVLVREEGMALKPTMLDSLTAEEILEYWSLLSKEQRSAFLDERIAALLKTRQQAPDGKAAVAFETRSSMFDRFAGVFHAFACLDQYVTEAIEFERWKDIEYRILGKKHDSLGSLVEKTLTENADDPTHQYVTLLSARESVKKLHKLEPEFYREHRNTFAELEGRLNEGIVQIRNLFDFDNKTQQSKFFNWFESMFELKLTASATQVVQT